MAKIFILNKGKINKKNHTSLTTGRRKPICSTMFQILSPGVRGYKNAVNGFEKMIHIESFRENAEISDILY